MRACCPDYLIHECPISSALGLATLSPGAPSVPLGLCILCTSPNGPDSLIPERHPGQASSNFLAGVALCLTRCTGPDKNDSYRNLIKHLFDVCALKLIQRGYVTFVSLLGRGWGFRVTFSPSGRPSYSSQKNLIMILYYLRQITQFL